MASPPTSSHVSLTGSSQAANAPSQETLTSEGPRPTLATIVLPPRRPVRGRGTASGSAASSASSRHGSRRGSFASSTASRASSTGPQVSGTLSLNAPANSRVASSAMSASSFARDGRSAIDPDASGASSSRPCGQRSRRRESDQSDSFEILERPSTFARSTMTQRNPIPSSGNAFATARPSTDPRQHSMRVRSRASDDDETDADYEESPNGADLEDDEVMTSRPRRRGWARPRPQTPGFPSRTRGGARGAPAQRRPEHSLLDELDSLFAADAASSPPPLPISPPTRLFASWAPAGFPLSPSPATQSRASSPLTELSYHSEDEPDAGAVIEPQNGDETDGRRLTREQKGKGRAVELTSGSSEGEDGAPLRLRKRFSEVKGSQRRRQKRKLGENGSYVETGDMEGSASSQNGEESGSGDSPVLLEPVAATGDIASKAGPPQGKRLEIPNREDRLDTFNCSICMCEPTDTVVTHCGHIYCSNCLLAAMLQAIARSPTVYDTHRPETPTRNRRNAPKPATYRNRGAQPKAWKPSELRGVITEYKRDQENRRRAVQARELETNLQTQGVDRNEWPASIEAAGFSTIPARRQAPAAPQNPARRTGGANAYNMPGSYGDFAEAAGFGATNLHEQPDAQQDDIKVEHVLQGLWKVDGGAWVVEGECPTCRNAMPGGFASPELGVGGVTPLLVRLRTRVQ